MFVPSSNRERLKPVKAGSLPKNRQNYFTNDQSIVLVPLLLLLLRLSFIQTFITALKKKNNMTQTAQIPDGQFLKLSDTDFRTASRNIAEDNQSDITAALGANKLFGKLSPLFYNGRIRLSFRIADEYKTDYILIKGLLEFHRPKDFLFTYYREQRSAVVDINANRLDHLQVFLSEIFKWVRQEKQFRHALKIVLEFEGRYKSERESVYQILENTTAAARAV